MGKSLYSLILNDEVVSEVDKAALRLGTNRSALINKILADHLGVLTPEIRYSSIFGIISGLVNDSMDLVVADGRRNSSILLKSFINVRYRPTIKYELSFDSSGGEHIGVLSVYYRTQSQELLNQLEYFFSLFVNTEKLFGKTTEKVIYSLEPGRFRRTFGFSKDDSAETIGNAILEYIRVFDYLLKDFVCYGDETRFVNEYRSRIGSLRI